MSHQIESREPDNGQELFPTAPEDLGPRPNTKLFVGCPKCNYLIVFEREELLENLASAQISAAIRQALRPLMNPRASED